VAKPHLAIDGVAEGIDDTAEETSTDGDVDDSTSALILLLRPFQ